METIKIEIEIPHRLKAFYAAPSIVEDAERDARFMYSYIADNSYSVETVAELLDADPKDLIDFYEDEDLPLPEKYKGKRHIDTTKVEIEIPNKFKNYYKTTSLAKEAERDARLFYSYIIDGSWEIEWVANILGVDTKRLITFYEEHNLPLDNIQNRFDTLFKKKTEDLLKK